MAKKSPVVPVYQIPTQKTFSFQTVEAWTKWLAYFERFRSASGLVDKPEREQANSLIYLMGQQAEDILISFKLSKDDLDKYDTVKEKFQTYFIPTRNVIYERYKFHTRSQDETESVEDFVTALHALVKYCNFSVSFPEDIIRDRIVCGICDKRISYKLQLESELTLEKAVATARLSETVKKQQEAFKTNVI